MLINNYLKSLVVSGFAVVAASSQVFASTVLSESVQTTTQKSVWVGRVKVTNLAVVAGLTSKAMPTTEVYAEILEVFKGLGEINQKIMTRIPGGVVGSKARVVVGAPAFKINEEYILFLNSNPEIVAEDGSVKDVMMDLVDWSAYHVIKRDDDSKVVIRGGETTLLKSVGNYQVLGHPTASTYDEFVSDIFRAQ
ncbi:MAG: hypothetical protein J0L93_03705 [Deltaproteobacteria bacterium]|nr:hypothetical protein [Deltaproteobacteria bacterium]